MKKRNIKNISKKLFKFEVNSLKEFNTAILNWEVLGGLTSPLLTDFISKDTGLFKRRLYANLYGGELDYHDSEQLWYDSSFEKINFTGFIELCSNAL